MNGKTSKQRERESRFHSRQTERDRASMMMEKVGGKEKKKLSFHAVSNSFIEGIEGKAIRLRFHERRKQTEKSLHTISSYSLSTSSSRRSRESTGEIWRWQVIGN